MTRRKISRTLSARRTLKPPFNTGSGDKKLSNLQQNYRSEKANTKDESKEPLGYGRSKAGLEFGHFKYNSGLKKTLKKQSKKISNNSSKKAQFSNFTEMIKFGHFDIKTANFQNSI